MKLSKDGVVSLLTPGSHDRISIRSCTLLFLLRRGQGRSRLRVLALQFFVINPSVHIVGNRDIAFHLVHGSHTDESHVNERVRQYELQEMRREVEIVVRPHRGNPFLEDPRGQGTHRHNAHAHLSGLEQAAKGARPFSRVLVEQVVADLHHVKAPQADKPEDGGVIVLTCKSDEARQTLVLELF